jgi:hypothetical protein
MMTDGAAAGCRADAQPGGVHRSLEDCSSNSSGISEVWVPYAATGSTSPRSIQDDRPDGPIEWLLLFHR